MTPKLEKIKSRFKELLREVIVLRRKNTFLREELYEKEKKLRLLEKKYLRTRTALKIATEEIENLIKELQGEK